MFIYHFHQIQKRPVNNNNTNTNINTFTNININTSILIYMKCLGFSKENETKPKECKEVFDDPPFSPKSVADGILNGINNGYFHLWFVILGAFR